MGARILFKIQLIFLCLVAASCVGGCSNDEPAGPGPDTFPRTYELGYTWLSIRADGETGVFEMDENFEDGILPLAYISEGGSGYVVGRAADDRLVKEYFQTFSTPSLNVTTFWEEQGYTEFPNSAEFVIPFEGASFKCYQSPVSGKMVVAYDFPKNESGKTKYVNLFFILDKQWGAICFIQDI